ncbi:MAG: CHC2 zinc finger domain-containing protein, partial [Clostridia bacterium]
MNNYAEIIRQRVPTSALIASLGLKRNHAGFICCPFHGEDTPSLRIYEGSRGWCCFGCNASGSVIDFVMRWYDIGYQQALIKLNYDFSLGLPIGRT